MASCFLFFWKLELGLTPWPSQVTCISAQYIIFDYVRRSGAYASASARTWVTGWPQRLKAPNPTQVCGDAPLYSHSNAMGRGGVRPRHFSHRARRQAHTTIKVEHMHTLRVAVNHFTAHYTAASLHHIVHVPGPAQRGPAASEDTGPLGHLCTGTGRLRLPCTRTTATHTTAPSALLTVVYLGVHI